LKTSIWQDSSIRRVRGSHVVALVAFAIFLIAARPFPASAADPAKKATEPATAPAVSATKSVAPATTPAVSKALLRVAKAVPAIKSAAAPAPQTTTPSGPRIWLDQSKPLSPTYVGTNTAGTQSATKAASGRPLPGNGGDGTPPPPPAGILAAGKATPLALASADFNEDGYDDLAVGYAAPGGGLIAIHRGNIDAFAPQSDASFQAIGRGEFPSPFLTNVQVFAVPVAPDFIGTGIFTSSGHTDIIIAARGGSALYLLPGDGKGNFGAPEKVDLPGAVTALASGRMGGGAYEHLLVGISVSSQQSDLVVFKGSDLGLTTLQVLALDGSASNILFGDFGGGPDAIFLAGDKPVILRSSLMQLVPVSVPVSARAIALGSFVSDRNSGSQIALLASDGSIQVAARDEFDPRAYTLEEFRTIRRARRLNEPVPLAPPRSFPANGWRIVESFPSVGSIAPGLPVFFRTRVSSNGADDIMWLNASTGQMAVVSHPDLAPGAATFVPGQVSVKAYSGSPITALPLRINVDGRPGVVALHQGQVAPSTLMPIPDPTFTVNRNDDPTPVSPITNACNGVANDCSLREAVLRANALAGTDTIMVPAGTYTLTIARVQNDCTGNFGALSLNDSVNIIGGGQNTTIIQAGSVSYNPGPANGVDMVMNVNEDLATANCPVTNSTASISNLTLQNGHNRGSVANFDGDGGCMEFDTGSSGTANLTLTNVTLQNCDVTDGNGGGIAIFNSNNSTGLATISTSIIQGNKAFQGGGTGTAGGVWVSDPSRMSMTGSQVLNNQAPNTNNTNQAGSGGGITVTSNTNNSRQTVIHSSTISGNQAAGEGGGIKTLANTLIDQGTIISNNSAGSANVTNKTDGGGIFMNPSASGCPGACTDSVTLTKVTITGNSAPHGRGGAISSGTGTPGGNLTMSFSRLAGNTAGTSGSNLENVDSTITATNNWWGTNAVSSTIHTAAGSTTFDPYVVLTHNGSPQKIRINQSSTLIGDLSRDNHGSNAALTGNYNQITGLPITFGTPVLGTIPQAQPEALVSQTATATFNGGSTSGLGSANATIDQAVVPVNSNLIASATESTTTVTITTVGVHGYSTGEFVSISGVGVAGYNGNFFPVTSTPTTTTFTYTAGTSGLAASSGGTANAGIILLQPPTMTKAFAPAVVAIGASSTITFSITNGNVVPINGSFTDSLPANLVVAATPNIVNTCGGSVTAAAAATSIVYSNPATQPVGTCTIKVDVSSAVDNKYTNTVTLDSTDAGNAVSASSATLVVINPPHIAKAFGAASIPLNGTTSLTITIDSNSNQNMTLNGTAFTDSLPTGLIVATPGNPSTTCSGGTVTATDGSSSIALSGASIAPNSSCTVTVTIQGTTAGAKSNNVQVSAATDQFADPLGAGGTGNTANATIAVVAPPTISKAFGAASVPLNGTTTLTFTITNPAANSVAVTGIAFSDTLTNGLQVAGTPGVTNSCGGTVTAAANSTSISLSSGSITTPGTTCTIVVNVTGTTAGTVSNTTGTVSSTNGGTGATSNTATLAVVAPPTISKAFGVASIPLNGNTTLTFTITNPAANTTAENGIAFSDTLTNGLTVATTPGVTNSCGGTVTATANSTSISLSSGTITTPGNTCTISVNVTGTVAGTVSNTTGTVSSTNGGTGATSNTATLLVVAPVTISKAFNPTSISVNTNSTLTFTITNPSTVSAQSGIAFTDTLPAGVVVATPNGVTGSCGSGTITATAGSGSISLAGGTLTISPAAGSSCTFSVNVTGTTAGVKSNTTGAISSTEGGTGTTSNTATLTVVAPPTISKAFNPTSVALGGASTLSFTITNPNTASALSGVAFTDNLPAGVIVATPNGLSGACGTGTVTATAGSSTITLSGGTLTASPAAGSSCTFSVNVTGTSAGAKSNTTGAVTSTEGGTGATSNTAVLTVVAPPIFSKAFSPASNTQPGDTSTLTITITNPAANTTSLTGIAFTDNLPAGLVVATPNGLVNTCNGTPTATAGSGSVSLTAGSIATPNTSCTVAVNVTTTKGGTNTLASVSSTNGGTNNTPASARLATCVKPPANMVGWWPGNGNANDVVGGNNGTLVNSPSFVSGEVGQAFSFNGSNDVLIGHPAALSPTTGVTVDAWINPATTPASLAGILTKWHQDFSLSATADAYAVWLNSSNQIFTAIHLADGTEPGLNGGVIPIGTANFTHVAMTYDAASGNLILYVNGVSAASTNVGAGKNLFPTAADAAIGREQSGQTRFFNGKIDEVEVFNRALSASEIADIFNAGDAGKCLPPAISKAFGAPNVSLNGTTTLTFTITKLATATTADAGIAFSDTLQNGLQVAATPGVVNTCGGTPVATAASTVISLTNGSITTPGATCTVTVNVTGTQSGVVPNTTSQVSSTNGGNGVTATASLTVASPPTITKSFNPTSIAVNTNSTLSFTISNPNTNVALSGVAFTDSLPAGLVVATPNGLTGSCGSGTITATAGSGSISLSGGTLTASPAAGSSCTFSVNVTGTTAGVKSNSVQVTSTEGGTGNTSSANLTVVAPPTISKSFNPIGVALNTSSTLSFTVTNPNAASTLSGVAFTDNLPAGVVVAATPAITGSCGSGTITATAGSSTITLSGGTLTASPAAGSSCTFSVSVTGTSAGAKSNTTGAITSTEGGTGATSNTAVLTVVAPPSIAKVFNPTTIALNGTTTLTFTITNPAANTVAENGVAFTDTLPAGLVVATPNGLSNTCGGTATATAGSTSISLTTGSIGINTSCTVVVNVTGTASGNYTNTTGAVTSTNGGTGNTATANLTVAAPPTITKSFNPTSIPVNTNSTLSFTISNPNTNVALSGVAFTDTLPAGVVVATPNGLTGSCGSGTITATAGSGSISLSGGTLTASPAAGSSCTFSVNVTGTTAGLKNNSVQVTSTEGGNGNTSNASLTVVGPATISKSFNPTSIALNATSTLSFTITNANTASALSGVGFTDNLPAGVVVAATPNITGSCGAGTITATAGSSTITLSGGTLTASPAAGSSCTFSVSVTGTTAGSKSNTTTAVTSTEGGTGTTSNTAVLTVVAPPSIAKVFNPTVISLNATTTLTFTITNPAANTVAEAGVAFSDTLPTGLVVATPNGLSNTCGGAATATAGSTSISLTAASIAVNTSCTVVVNVTGTASGNYTNTTGAVTSTNGGTGNTATANLTVASPPTITKNFGAASIPRNSNTTLTFVIANPNTNTGLTGVAFTDTLPAGLQVATPNGLTGSCGSGTITAVAGSGSVSLSGGTLTASPAAGSSCTITVNVTGVTAGVQNNSVQVTSTEGGTGNTSNASVTVVAPPVIIKAFGAASIPLNGTTTLQFTIQNQNTTTTLTGVGFSDTLPAGLIISTPNGLAGNTCTGTLTATQNTNVISLSGASINQSTSCTFTINVTGTTAGTQTNTTGNVTSTEGGTGGTATASVTVVAPPSIVKAFGATAISLNGTTTLTFTITNPAGNTVAENGVAFTDTLPTGLVVATPNGLSNTCGGAATATAGSTSISLAGGTIATPGSTCTVVVNVTGTTSGNYTNTSGAVSSTNGGTGNTATANLTVASPPTITKSFGAASIPRNTNTTLTFVINNPNTNVALTGVAFTDNLPAGLQVATPNGLTGSCGSGTITAVAGSGSVSLSGGTMTASPAAGSSCTITVNVTGITAGVQNNSVQVTSTEGGPGNTSNASITVVAAPVLIKAFGAASIPLNGTTTLQFTIQNNNTTTTLTGVGFTDTLPAGLVVATPNGLAGNTCTGTLTATQNTNVISLSGASLNQSTSCTFTINVTGTAAGTKNNVAGPVTSTEGGTGGTASASIDVVAPPSIVKAFGATGIPLNGTTSLTLTITNPPANGIAETGVAVTDNLPAGLVVATPNGLTNTCGGTGTAVAGGTTITLTGGTIAASSTCTVTVNVTGTVSGNYTNTTGAVSSTNGGTGNTASANLSVAAPPSIAKSFGAATIPLNGSTSLSFTITNPVINTIPLTVAFTDTLPAGLVVATPNGLANTCGGTVTATAGSGSVSLSGGTVAINSNCTLTVNITGTTAGVKNNSVQVTSTQGGPGNTSNASITVVAPPSITKAFGAATLAVGSTTSLTLTITNPNTTVTLTGVAVTDTMPFGLLVSVPGGATNTCGGTATVDPHSVTLSGGTLAPSASCTVTVTVRAVAGGGTRVNTTGNVTSTNGGTGNQATASINVPGPPLNIALTVTGAANVTINPGDTATFVFTVNSGDPALGGINFSCNTPLPAGATCTFDNQGETQGTVQVTLSFTTTGPSAPTRASNQPQQGRGAAPLYAVLLLPVFGVVGLTQLRRGKKGLRLRLAMWLGGLIVLAALVGCGGGSSSLLGGNGNGGTPPGLYPITVTATSSANPSITATTNVSVTVR
jgi:uncharacterized repeat protein (TIGR01451 family)